MVMGGSVAMGTAGKGSKSKKRSKVDSGSPENEVMRRKPSVKKKKDDLAPNGGATQDSSGNGVYSSPALPPSYDEVLKGT